MAKFHERRGEEGEANGRRMSDRLIACGPSAIKPILQTIRRSGTWNRTYAYLPRALKGLGTPAHQALLTAIDSEQDRRARAYLISALQDAFADYSRFDLWLIDATNSTASSFQMTFFAGDIRRQFPEAPDLHTNGQISAEFVEWWRTNKHTKEQQ